MGSSAATAGNCSEPFYAFSTTTTHVTTMCATPWLCATPRALRLVEKGQIRVTRAANSLPLARIGYGVVTVTINSVTTALRSTHASTPILGEFSGIM
jgi:hypothetical protein